MNDDELDLDNWMAGNVQPSPEWRTVSRTFQGDNGPPYRVDVHSRRVGNYVGSVEVRTVLGEPGGVTTAHFIDVEKHGDALVSGNDYGSGIEEEEADLGCERVYDDDELAAKVAETKREMDERFRIRRIESLL